MTPFDILTSSGKHPERPVIWPPSDTILTNAIELSLRISQLLLDFVVSTRITKEPAVVSGYRPKDVNEKVQNAAPNSNHMRCMAADIEDEDGSFASFCTSKLDVLERIALWMEDPTYTRTIKPGESKKLPLGQHGWVHLQSVPPKSGHRVFIPYAGGPP